MPPQKISALTPQQREAVAMEANTVTAAGAGTGKTHTLTHLYLDLLETGRCTTDQIVALTFTDKAAAQMKARVRDGMLARMDSNPALWRACYLGLDRALITTYNSFGMTLVKRFALCAGIDPYAAVLDEGDAAALRLRAVEETFPPPGPAADSLLALVPYHDGQGPFGPGGLANRMAGELPRADTSRLLDAVARFASGSVSARGGLCSRIRSSVSALAPCKTGADEYQAFMAAWREMEGELEPASLSPAWVARLEAFFARCHKTSGHKVKGLTPLREAVGEYRALCLSLGAVPAVEELARWIDRAAALYRELKREAGAIDFDDQVRGVLDMLLRSANRPVLEQLQNEFKFIIVDEFQDTDRCQSDLIGLLSRAAENRRNLFVVGDPKQSIYAFRGADIRAYESMRRKIVRAGGVEKPLTGNFRSLPGILRFVNTLFFENLPADREIFDPRFRLDPRRGGGEAADGGPGQVCLFQAREFSPDLREREARAVAWKILDLATAPPAVSMGQIAVLARTNAALGPVRDELQRLHVPFYFYRGTGFFECQEIAALHDLLRVLADENDEPALVRLLLGLLGPARPTDIGGGGLRNFWTREGLPALLAATRERLAPVRAKMHRRTVDETLAAAVDALCVVPYLLVLPDGLARTVNVSKLIEMSRQFAAVRHGTVGDFVALLDGRVETGRREVSAPVGAENLDAVKLMTVHAAKGLEFPVVFFVGLGGRVRNSMPVFGVSEDIAEGDLFWLRARGGAKLFDSVAARERLARLETQEAHRLLYVGLTRARDRLFLSGDVPSRSTRIPWAQAQGEGGSFRALVEHYAPPAGQPSALERVDYEQVLEGGRVRGPARAGRDIRAWLDSPLLGGAVEPFPRYEHRRPSSSPDEPDDRAGDEAEGGGETANPAAAGGLDTAAGPEREWIDFSGRGTVGHRVLELLYETPETDGDFYKCDAAGFSALSEADRAFVIRGCRLYLASPYFRMAFAREAREVPFTRREEVDGAVVFVEGLIDRLCFDAQGRAHIFDYKFARYRGPAYREQMREYRLAVERAGYEVASCRILYLGGDTLVADDVPAQTPSPGA